jgi:hypothetical protein
MTTKSLVLLIRSLLPSFPSVKELGVGRWTLSVGRFAPLNFTGRNCYLSDQPVLAGSVGTQAASGQGDH